VEVLRTILKEGPALGVSTQEKIAQAPVSVEAAGANMTPRINGGHANEAEPRPEDASGGVALILDSPWGPDFSLPQETASEDVMSIPGSFDIVDLGASEMGMPGYPRAPLLSAN
jgi:hypothetical protein